MNHKEREYLKLARDAEYFEGEMKTVTVGAPTVLAVFLLTMAVGLTIGITVGVSLERIWAAEEAMK